MMIDARTVSKYKVDPKKAMVSQEEIDRLAEEKYGKAPDQSGVGF